MVKSGGLEIWISIVTGLKGLRGHYATFPLLCDLRRIMGVSRNAAPKNDVIFLRP